MSLKLNSSGGGSVTLQEPTTASNVTLNLPAADGTIITTASTFAGTGPAFSAYPSASQSVSNTTFVKLQFNTEEFDTNTNYDPSTNYRFTPSVAGYYQVNIEVTLNSYSASTGQTFLVLYKNGSVYRYIAVNNNSGNSISIQGTELLLLNGSTDYIEAYIYQNSGATQTVAINSQQYNKFSASLVRSA